MKFTDMLLVRVEMEVVSGVSGVNAIEYADYCKHCPKMG